MLLSSSDSSSDTEDEFHYIERTPKIIKPRINHFQLLNDTDFYVRFRLNKETCMFLLHRIEPHITLSNK